jgi:hypothetical protein
MTAMQALRSAFALPKSQYDRTAAAGDAMPHPGSAAYCLEIVPGVGMGYL